jgi:hypothetical protein
VLARLGLETSLGNYRIRPPHGYRLERRHRSGGEFFSWKGPVRFDGSTPQLLVSVVPVPPEGRETPPDEYLDGLLDICRKGQASTFPTWNAGRREQGRINGIPFTRARISGSSARGAGRMTGFAYLTLDDDNLVFMLSQDIAPHDGEALSLAEASVLTLRR